MNSKLNAFCLTIAAVIAAMALSASVAPAADFHSEASHTIISGSQVGEDTLTLNAGTIKCGEATYAGTQSSATSETQRVSPTYTECVAFGFINTTIDVNGCEFEDKNDGNHIICPENKVMTLTAFNCWVTIGPQENPKSLTHTNQGSGKSRDIWLSLNIEGIKYTQHSKSFPGCSKGTFTNGKYTGAATVKGTNTAGEQVGIWYE